MSTPTTNEETVLDILGDFGLTAKESEIYVLLCKKGPLKGLEVSKMLGMHKGEAYRVLKSLQRRGMVESIIESPLRFSALSFERFLNMHIEAKRREADTLEKKKGEILEQWRSLDSERSNPSEDRFLVISGAHNIYSKVLQMWGESSQEVLGISTLTDFTQTQKRGVMDGIVSIAAKKRVTPSWCSKIILDFPERNIEAMKRYLKRSEAKHANIEWRYTDLTSNSHLRFVIKDAEEVLFFLTNKEKPNSSKQEVCFWTNSESLVLSFKTIHETIWPNSQNIAKHIEEIEARTPTEKPRIKKKEAPTPSHKGSARLTPPPTT
ncbi:MAG: hypothetical protein M1503_01705 [Thaumarchaeota archaeon]|nr:hypothetical protein [Nitrososphaerota archaeon]MCL5316972.1 hypothetical protein [Nitrososphaerota archaeon]